MGEVSGNEASEDELSKVLLTLDSTLLKEHVDPFKIDE
jgi:hypothetical protein